MDHHFTKIAKELEGVSLRSTPFMSRAGLSWVLYTVRYERSKVSAFQNMSFKLGNHSQSHSQ